VQESVGVNKHCVKTKKSEASESSIGMAGQNMTVRNTTCHQVIQRVGLALGATLGFNPSSSSSSRVDPVCVVYYLSICIYLSVCLSVYLSISIHLSTIYICIYIYVCVYIYIYIYIYIYVYIHTHIYICIYRW